MDGIIANRGISSEELPLRAESKFPTVSEAVKDGGSGDDQWLNALEYSQPWSVVDASISHIMSVQFALSGLAMHARSPGFVGTYDNAVQSLPEDAANYLEKYRSVGDELLKVLHEGGELTIEDLQSRMDQLFNEGTDILHGYINQVQET